MLGLIQADTSPRSKAKDSMPYYVAQADVAASDYPFLKGWQ